MNITVKVRGAETFPGERRGVALIEATITPAATGPQFPPHTISVSTDGALCEVKGAVIDAIHQLMRHEMRAPNSPLMEAPMNPVPRCDYADTPGVASLGMERR